MHLADAVIGRRVAIATLDLDREDAAWLAAVGLHEGEVVIVLRRAVLGGPLHVRTSAGGEFAVDRDLARRILVKEEDQ
jgi:ferrous iron transport protein A